MSEANFQAKLDQLVLQLGEMPSPIKEKMQEFAKELTERRQRMKKTVDELQESLDYLRLQVKYMVFDLEATRRENKYLRTLLEKTPNPGENSDE